MSYKERVTLYYYFESVIIQLLNVRKQKNELETLPCNRNTLTAEKVRIEFGEVTKDINVIRLPKVLDYEPTHASMYGKEYKVIKTKTYQHSTSLYVKEVV